MKKVKEGEINSTTEAMMVLVIDHGAFANNLIHAALLLSLSGIMWVDGWWWPVSHYSQFVAVSVGFS